MPKSPKHFNRLLIHLVHEQPVLWQTKLRKWSPNLNLDEIWSRIGTQLCCSGTEAKNKWHKLLRVTYVRIRRKILSAPTPEESARIRANVQWPYFEALSFLEGHVCLPHDCEVSENETDLALNGILNTTNTLDPSNGDLLGDGGGGGDSSLPQSLKPRTVNIRDHEEYAAISTDADTATFSQVLENLEVTPIVIDSADSRVTPAEIEAIRKRRLREAMSKIREKKAALQEDRNIKQLLTELVSLQTSRAEDTRTDQAKWLLSYEQMLISVGSRYELKIRAKVNAAFEEVLAEKAAEESALLQQSVDCMLNSRETQ